MSNQDSLTLQQVVTGRGRLMMAAVSDGIGGLWEGENASGYIMEKLVENFYGQLIPLAARGKRRNIIQNSFLRCFCGVNEELRRYAAGKGIKLGATVSVLLIWKKRYMILHLGDSRIYLYHRGVPRLLTKDHSDKGGGLTRCMGSFPYQRPDIQSGAIHGRSGFLLCTDGFYRTFDSETIKALNPDDIRGGEQIERRLGAMASSACRKGEQDNMSAIYLITDREGT